MSESSLKVILLSLLVYPWTSYNAQIKPLLILLFFANSY